MASSTVLHMRWLVHVTFDRMLDSKSSMGQLFLFPVYVIFFKNLAHVDLCIVYNPNIKFLFFNC